jgi:general secretion pathway protein A
MYNEHFGFVESPFTATPNSRFFYTNDLYQEAFANLRYGIEWKKGLIVMTGEVGTGKTTLLCKMMRSLKPTTHPVFVSSDQLTSTELLRFISKELGLATDGKDRLATVEQLRDYLITLHKKGHVAALLIDEAQNLSDEMFESIRCLSNLETEKEKLLQIVLTGQPELATRLGQLSLRHLKQRMVLHCRLAPLDKDEVGRYIDFRLQEAGYEGKDLFSTEVVSQIAYYSGGIPRLINIICDNSLLLAFAGSQRKVTTEMIHEVARDLGLKNSFQLARESSATAIEGTADELCNSSLEAVERQKEPVLQHKSGLALTPIAVALVMLGSAGGALYSEQIKYYLAARGTSSKGSTEVAQTSNRDPALPAQSIVVRQAEPDSPKSKPAQPQPTPSNAKPSEVQQRQIETKPRESLLGRFEVVGPFSFVRRRPRSDAEIIATLQPRTQIKVVSMRGDYFRILAFVDGKTIRGYVHREDAFFERAKANGKRKSPGQSNNQASIRVPSTVK